MSVQYSDHTDLLSPVISTTSEWIYQGEITVPKQIYPESVYRKYEHYLYPEQWKKEWLLESTAEINIKLLDIEKQLTPTKVIFSGNCCIAFFPDGKKIIVRKNEEDEFDEYTAVAYCIVKYIFESNSHYKKAIDKVIKVREYPKGEMNE